MRLWSSANHQLLAKNVYSLTSWWKPLFLENCCSRPRFTRNMLTYLHTPASHSQSGSKTFAFKAKDTSFKITWLLLWRWTFSVCVAIFFKVYRHWGSSLRVFANNSPTSVETTGNHSSLLVAKARTTKSSSHHSLWDHFQLATSSNHLPTSLGTVATSGCITSYMQTTFMQCVYDVTWKTATPQWNSRKVFKV